MRALGLDLGTKTLGIAISKTGTIASPYKVIRYCDMDKLLTEVNEIINQETIEKIVIGLPKNMNNSEGFAADRSKEFAKALSNICDKEIILIDERLTTKEAENVLINGNVSRIKRKKVIDSLAATLILESYLNRKGE